MAVALVSHRAGVLLAAEFCINGTGGCWQEFLFLRDSQWRELGDPYDLLVAELKRRGVLLGLVAPRLAMPRTDIRTLRGSSGLYGPEDGNCCPARRVDFQLELTDQGFRLLELRVAANSF